MIKLSSNRRPNRYLKCLGKKKINSLSSNLIAGFTFIETMITLLIVAIVGVIGVISYSKYSNNLEVMDMQEFLRNVSELQNNFFTENRRYSDDLQEIGIVGGIPENIRNSVDTFALGVETLPNGRQSFLAVINPDNKISKYKNFYPLAIDSDFNRFYSTNLLCKYIKPTDNIEYIINQCTHQNQDPVWGDRPVYKHPSLQDFISGKARSPLSIKGVNNGCSYAIAIRDYDTFISLKCQGPYRWPYRSKSSQPLSEKCLKAFNSNNRRNFTSFGCCGKNNWITKATAYCSSHGAQPTSPASYTSRESAGQLRLGGGCLRPQSWPITNGSPVRLWSCHRNQFSSWYNDRGMWRNAADPRFCLWASGSTHYRHNKVQVRYCNLWDRRQTSIRYDPRSRTFNMGRGRCFTPTGRGGLVSVWHRCRRSGVSTHDPASASAVFDSFPECLQALRSSNFRKYSANSCCNVSGYTGRDINCGSRPISIPQTAATAKEILIGSDTKLVSYQPTNLVNRGVVQWTTATINKYKDTHNPVTKWYLDANGNLKSPDLPDLCLTDLGQGTNYQSLQMRKCGSHPRQQWETVGGQIRSVKSNRCLTTWGYKTSGNRWMGPFPCKAGYTNNFRVGS